MEIVTKEFVDLINKGQVSVKDLDNLLLKSEQRAVEHMLQILPNVIDYLIRQTGYIKKLGDDFYNKHQDLANHKQEVSKILETVEAENPGKPYEELLQLAAPRAREHLKKMGKFTSKMETPDLERMDSNLGNL